MGVCLGVLMTQGDLTAWPSLHGVDAATVAGLSPAGQQLLQAL
jgi:hypothetical protein